MSVSSKYSREKPAGIERYDFAYQRGIKFREVREAKLERELDAHWATPAQLRTGDPQAAQRKLAGNEESTFEFCLDSRGRSVNGNAFSDEQSTVNAEKPIALSRTYTI